LELKVLAMVGAFGADRRFWRAARSGNGRKAPAEALPSGCSAADLPNRVGDAQASPGGGSDVPDARKSALRKIADARKALLGIFGQRAPQHIARFCRHVWGELLDRRAARR